MPQTWPTLYGKTSTDGVKVWQIAVEERGGGVAIVTHHGKLNGKQAEKIKLVSVGKNLGKSNETTPWQQAVSEAESAYAEKLDKKYQTEIPGDEDTTGIILPMLAQDFRKRAHNIVYGAFVQPKFNGVRCLVRRVDADTFEFISRKGKSYNAICQHLIPDLKAAMKAGEIFDGELYVHGWSFQRILKTTKKLRPWGEELEYHVYDVADENQSFLNRLVRLDAVAQLLPKNSRVKMVATSRVPNADMVKHWHDLFVADGYEGVIIRNAAAPYKFDHRSKDLQKYKEFEDAEFEIVDFESEQVNAGADQAVVFVVKNDDGSGRTFSARPRGSVAQRIKWWNERDQLRGKMLTVRFLERSEDNIPIGNTVGVCIRDYE